MVTLILVLLALLVIAASFTSMLVFRDRVRGLRLIILAPVPGALVIGGLAAAYVLSYAQDYRAVAVLSGLLVLGAWGIGFVLCAIIVGINKRSRGVPGERHA